MPLQCKSPVQPTSTVLQPEELQDNKGSKRPPALCHLWETRCCCFSESRLGGRAGEVLKLQQVSMTQISFYYHEMGLLRKWKERKQTNKKQILKCSGKECRQGNDELIMRWDKLPSPVVKNSDFRNRWSKIKSQLLHKLCVTLSQSLISSNSNFPICTKGKIIICNALKMLSVMTLATFFCMSLHWPCIPTLQRQQGSCCAIAGTPWRVFFRVLVSWGIIRYY